MVGVAYAGQVGDMNADGEAGLGEAITALKVAAGVVPGISPRPFLQGYHNGQEAIEERIILSEE